MNSSRPLIIANWKMNGLCESARELVTQIAFNKYDLDNVVVCPPFTALSQVGHAICSTKLRMGGQDCHAQENGAYTGDISAEMLKNNECDFVILGHSERRKRHHETDLQVRKKAEAAHRAGLITIICVGEPKKIREQGRAVDFIKGQVKHSLPKGTTSTNTIIAYEPVWAIGTGNIPTKKEIGDAHESIISFVSANFEECRRSISVIYGGSVTPDNTHDILSIDGVGGVLVGGASLDSDAFRAIVKVSKEINLE